MIWDLKRTKAITLKGRFMIDFKKLVKAGVHFGHQRSRWNPKMAPYIWGYRDKIHLIDISRTAFQLEKSAKFLTEIASQGKQVLWVGTKKAAVGAITEAGTRLGDPSVINRWLGGTLTNFSQIKKSVTKYLHMKDIVEKSDSSRNTKKELNLMAKQQDKMGRVVEGIVPLKWPIGALVVVDVKCERAAVREAVAAGIPVVALVDTNCDPTPIDYVIPGNDDAPRSVKVIIDYLVEAVEKGKAVAAKRKLAAQEEKAKAAESSKTVKKSVKTDGKKFDKKAPAAKADAKKPVAKKAAEPKVEAAPKGDKVAKATVKAAPKKAKAADSDKADTDKAPVKEPKGKAESKKAADKEVKKPVAAPKADKKEAKDKVAPVEAAPVVATDAKPVAKKENKKVEDKA